MTRLISAVGAVIRKRGCLAVGVNSVAQEAGVDKVLVYRYFGSFNNLLKEYVSSSDYYRTAASMMPLSLAHSTEKHARTEGVRIIIEQLRRLRKLPELQEIYRWELTADNPVTRSLAEQREREGTALLSMFSKQMDFSKADVPALSAVVLAGGIYLVLRAKTTGLFNSIDLETREGWQRIEQAIAHLLFTATRRATLPKRGRARTSRTPQLQRPRRRIGA